MFTELLITKVYFSVTDIRCRLKKLAVSFDGSNSFIYVCGLINVKAMRFIIYITDKHK